MTRQGRPVWLTVLLLVLCAGLVVVFVLLGNWQMRRLAWKLDLIEAVETRARGAPAALPGAFTPDAHSYLRVEVGGSFAAETPVLVKAVTELGPGYWVMMPLQGDGRVIWVNRGFVPTSEQDPANWDAPTTPVAGLLRPTEPDGTLLERNDQAVGRWVSRDVLAMSEAAGLGETAPYFIDADHSGPRDAWPRGGMTRISFRNTHLAYALTWYAMAALLSGAVAWLVRGGLRRR